jgi:hypothetical protein
MPRTLRQLWSDEDDAGERKPECQQGRIRLRAKHRG